MDKESVPPVAVGEEVVLTIEGSGEKGDGVGRVKNFVVFVKGAKKGDRIKIKIVKVFKKMGFGEIIEKLERPKRRSAMDLPDAEPEPASNYEDSEDFGEE
jgi:predicted RNA-binding protein with TRAM domain